MASFPGLQPGRVGTATLVVTPDDTALAVGSGDVPVLATPRVVLLAEQAGQAALPGSVDGARVANVRGLAEKAAAF